MIIETRYRDIPFKEAVKCEPRKSGKVYRDWWNSVRGKPISIKTPPFFRDEGSPIVCKEPQYVVVGGVVAVCPHIAEIGD